MHVHIFRVSYLPCSYLSHVVLRIVAVKGRSDQNPEKTIVFTETIMESHSFRFGLVQRSMEIAESHGRVVERRPNQYGKCDGSVGEHPWVQVSLCFKSVWMGRGLLASYHSLSWQLIVIQCERLCGQPRIG